MDKITLAEYIGDIVNGNTLTKKQRNELKKFYNWDKIKQTNNGHISYLENGQWLFFDSTVSGAMEQMQDTINIMNEK